MGALEERSSRNQDDIQALWRRSTKHGEDLVRVEGRLENLERGQKEAKTERERQGGVLDAVATHLGVNQDGHSHPPPAPAEADTSPSSPVRNGSLAWIPIWLRWAAVGVTAILVILGMAAQALGIVKMV